MENFTIKKVFADKLNDIKKEMYEELLYKKVTTLFQIWQKQKELGYLYDVYSAIESKKVVDIGPIYNINDSLSYKTQYISFLMEQDLIWIEECENSEIVLTMIYYWLLADIKKDKKILNNF